MKIRVVVLFNHEESTEAAKFTDFIHYSDPNHYVHDGEILRDYTMDHNDPAQRRILGEQCRNAFEAGQCVLTYPVAA